MAKAKKTSLVKLIGIRGIAILSGFVAANIAGMKIRYNSVIRKMNQNDQNNLMNSQVMGKGSMDIGEDVQNVYITCLSGGMDARLNAVPKKGEIFVDLFSVAARVTLALPKGARIEYDGAGSFTSIKDIRESNDEENLYTVYLYRRSVMSKIVIKDRD